jgi:hypothetical protein
MNGLMFRKTVAHFGGGNVARNGGEQMNLRFAKDNFVRIAACGARSAAEFFRRDYETQRVQPEAGAASAAIEKR